MEMERKVLDLNLDDILPNRFQPRIKFDETAINDLAESIKEHGVIQPIIVRKIGDKYEIIAGERRYKASVLAGKTTIPVIVTDLDDQASAEVALIENVQREDLTPIEEAVSYRKILDMGYLTQEELANKLDRNQSTIANKLRLLNLNEEVQEALLNEKISERHARSLLRLSNPKGQQEMLERIINERMTVRKTDEAIDTILNNDKPSEKLEINPLFNKEEEVKMNNNMSNSIFNIPSEPIIDEERGQQEDNEILSYDNIEEPNANIIESQNKNDDNGDFINPGFMNVEKIEEQAKDIYVEKPLVNINELLEPSNVDIPKIEAAKINVEEDADGDDELILKPGKFFNFGNENKEDAPLPEAKEEVFVGNSFADNQFNYDFKSGNDNSKEAEVVNFNDGIKEENNVPTIDNHDAYLNNSNFNDFFNPVIEESFTNNNTIPVLGSGNLALDEVMNKSNENTNYGQGNVTLPDFSGELIAEKNNDLVKAGTYMAGDLKTVINTIRNCAETIEKYGFVVDTEELDFEDSYQVVFKIAKKK